jgi:hypothetical protein
VSIAGLSVTEKFTTTVLATAEPPPTLEAVAPPVLEFCVLPPVPTLAPPELFAPFDSDDEQAPSRQTAARKLHKW